MPTGQYSDSAVGSVTAVSGVVFLESQNGMVTLQEGSSVFQDSIIVTEQSSHVEIVFNDNTVLSQGENGRLTIDDYIFDAGNSDNSNLLFELGQGTFRVITGEIARQNPEQFNVKSPLASIGIRGTDFSVQTGGEQDLVMVNQIDVDHVMIVMDQFGTIRFMNEPGTLVIIREGEPIGETRFGTQEEVDLLLSLTPITFQLEESGVGAGSGESLDGHDSPTSDLLDNDYLYNDRHEGFDSRDQHDSVLTTERAELSSDDALLDPSHSPAVAGMHQSGLPLLFGGSLFSSTFLLTGSNPFAGSAVLGNGASSLLLWGQDAFLLGSDSFYFSSQSNPFTPNYSIFDPFLTVSSSQTLVGTSGNDVISQTLVGTSGNDIIFGNASNNVINGLDGNDLLSGGAGADNLSGGGGTDTLKGGTGIDTLLGDVGNDTFVVWGTFAAGAYAGADPALDSLAVTNAVSHVAAGGQIDGGTGTDILVTYGTTNFSNTTVTSVETVQMHSDVTFDASQLNGSGVDDLQADGNGILRFSGTGSTNLSIINMTGVSTLDIGAGVILILSQANLADVTSILGNGQIIAAPGETLDFTGITVSPFVDQPGNDEPVFTSSASLSAAENASAAGTAVVIDPDGEVPTFSINGGADAALFSINATSGALSFNNAPNFEAPGDVGTDNTYNVDVTADDGVGATTLQAIAVTVTDVVEIGGIAPVELGVVALDANNSGFVIKGIDAGDTSGYSVSSAGDVNSDGLADLIIGARSAHPGGIVDAGESYVVFGKSDGTVVNLSAVAGGTGGFVINGIDSTDRSGMSVSSAGDVNGDGLDDLIIGARLANPGGNVDAGESYVVFGKADGTVVDLITVVGDGSSGSGGFVIKGIDADDRSGYSVSSAGDVNGDGLDDLIVGVPWADPGGIVNAGESYVVFGKSDGTVVNLSAVAGGTGGFVINGIDAADYSGYSVSSAGDVNGDGLDDLIIGAPFADPGGIVGAGESYVVFGKSDGTVVNLSAVAGGTGGFVINGIDADDRSGYSVSSAGDVNGDGLDDLIVGARYADPGGIVDAGESYVVFGKSDGTVVNLSAVAGGTGGFVINGIDAEDYSGWSVSSAGDVNGDGLDDLIIGAYYADPGGITYAGESYVVFGKSDGTVVNLSAVAGGTGGFVINGIDADDSSGWSVSSAGDVNGDGFADLIIGAPDADPNTTSQAGESYVIFGGDFTGDVTQMGTTGADTLTGTAGADNLVGGQGDDVLIGNGGADVLYGGSGDDLLAVSDLSFSRIDGGSGSDTLRLDGTSQHLDLTTLADSKISAIEIINLNSNSNTLSLGNTDLTNLLDANHTLTVEGDGNNTVNLSLTGYTYTDNTGSGGYHEFSDGITTLKIAPLVAVTGFNFDPVGASETVASPAFLQSVLAIDATELLANDTDANAGTNLSISALSNAANCAVTLVGTTINFQANTGFTGNANFDYTISDGNGGTATATATVVVDSKIELSSLVNNTNNSGLVINGIDVNDQSGDQVSFAGDVNGDGLADLIIGAPGADPGTLLSAGESYVVFGKSGGVAVDLLSDVVNGSGGFVINGIAASDQSGASVSSAGDVNGDGLADLIIGAPNANGKGQSYVVFGKSGDTNAIDLSALGTGGFVINGNAASDHSGISVSSAGDVNGDGLADLIIGADRADPGGAVSAGESYVVFGKSGDTNAIDLSALGTGGFKISGIDNNDKSGYSVSSAGDVNGDGLDDLLVGAPGGNVKAGETYVIYGKTDGTAVELSALVGDANSSGFVINGIDSGNIGGDQSGSSVSSAGDVNGDGLADIIIGAPIADPVGANVQGDPGESYVVFGKTGGVAVDLSDVVNGNGGFVINGIDWQDRSGTSVSSAGDVNGDGLADLIIGSSEADPNGDSRAGESYVVYGKSDGTLVDLSAVANGVGGFIINGIDAHDFSAHSVSSAGDVNGDGFADLIVGAFAADPAGNNAAGESYVIFGGDFSGDVTQMGTTGADTLTGTTGADNLIGGQGNDILTGDAGIDVLYGGAGDDSIDGGADNDIINGGSGDDTLLGLAGDDLIDGGDGSDTVSYFGDVASVNINLAGRTALDGFGGTDKLTDIENVIGSGFADTITGDGGDNVLSGGGGNDIFHSGVGGNDTLSGGAGNDIFSYAQDVDAKADTIIDFNALGGNSDKIHFDANSNLFGAASTAASGMFVVANATWGLAQKAQVFNPTNTTNYTAGNLFSYANLNSFTAAFTGQSLATGVMAFGLVGGAKLYGLIMGSTSTTTSITGTYGGTVTNTNYNIASTYLCANLTNVTGVGNGADQISAADIIIY